MGGGGAEQEEGDERDEEGKESIQEDVGGHGVGGGSLFNSHRWDWIK